MCFALVSWLLCTRQLGLAGLAGAGARGRVSSGRGRRLGDRDTSGSVEALAHLGIIPVTLVPVVPSGRVGHPSLPFPAHDPCGVCTRSAVDVWQIPMWLPLPGAIGLQCQAPPS